MFLNYKKASPISLSILSIFVLGCGGGQKTEENMSIGESIEVPETGAAIAGNPDGLPTNSPPQIHSISLGCDLITESVAITVGETVEFTLSVVDEFPSTLKYSVSTDNPLILSSTVDESGVVSLSGLVQGETIVPVLVTDEAGLRNEVLISVVVGV